MEEKIIVFSDILNNRASRELVSSVSGKDLALNPAQISGLSNSYQAKIMEFQKSNQPIPEVTSMATENVIEPNVVNEEIAPAVENMIPVEPFNTPVDAPQVPVEDIAIPVTESVIPEVNVTSNIIADETPVVTDIPSMEPVIPVDVVTPSVADIVDFQTPEVGQVEIVPNEGVSSDYDMLIEKIVSINEKYDKQIADINFQRNNEILSLLDENKQKLTETEAQIADLKNRAEEHLKNAQAAEQIATIAHQNAQNVQTPIDFPGITSEGMQIAS